jgi:ribonuclease HII
MLKSNYNPEKTEAGCDEAGRGCLAGPVYAAAVIFPKNYRNKALNDSKKLSEKDRLSLRKVIEEDALAWAVASVDNTEIDAINILNASFLAMHRAVSKLSIKPELLLIDGNRFKPYPDIPHHCIIEGDAKFLSIAGASILAKTYRDDFMLEASKKYACYDWQSNKGYPTFKHREGIRMNGPCPLHRMSFTLLPKQLQLAF